ncbi:MAG: histidine phosphatase family protein [Alphaproteobacteria bacterium]|nr:histidine phosphatase family protein [Alphaproteobacteria bacterium]
MLYIVRHGKTDWNLEDRIQGVADVPLNATGRDHAYNVAEKLSGFQIQKIISSNLSRARETAQIIGDKLHIRVDYDARIREYDFGKLTGLKRAEIDPLAVQMFFTNPTEFGAERLEDAFARVACFLEDNDYDKNTLVVTHGGVINFIMCYLENKNTFHAHSYLDKCLNVKIDNASVLRIKDLKSNLDILKNTRFYRLQKSK